MKKVYEATAYVLVVGAAAGAVAVCGFSWTSAVLLAKYVAAGWIVVRCRPLYVSLPLATLVFWMLSIGPPILAQWQRSEGSSPLPQLTSFAVYFPLIVAGLYSSLCYAAASVFHAVWMRQDRSGHLRTVIALVSAAQLVLAVVVGLSIANGPHTTAFEGTLGGLFAGVALGSLLGFTLGRSSTVRTALLYFNGVQVVIWLAYLFFVERFAEMTHAGCRCRVMGSMLFGLGAPFLALCLINSILVRLMPPDRA